MTQKLTLIVFSLIFFYISTFGQIEEVSIGPGYSFQTFYNLSTGETTQIANEDWDIAFSNLGDQDAGIFINESTSFMSNGLKLFVTDILEWSTPITDLTQFVDESILYNQEMNWTDGAFNSIKDISSPFDYGWGTYNPTNHVIEGNKIFVIKKRDDTFLKVQITQLVDGDYFFRYADLDGENEINKIVSKNFAGDNPIIYFSFESGETVDTPENYDLVFQRYSTQLDDGNGSFVEYIVTGVLLAPNTKAVVADDVDPETVMENDYSNLYTEIPNTIGHDWKYFDFSSGWNVFVDRVYFVQTKENKKYKIVFYDFEGSSTGNITFGKTNVGTVSFVEKSLDKNIYLYPNPASNYIHLKGLDTEYDAFIYDLIGRKLVNTKVNKYKEEINIQNLGVGVYSLILRNKNTNHSYIFSVNK